MDELLIRDLQKIEAAYKDYYNSDDGEGWHLKEYDCDVYLVLKNGNSYNFPISDFFRIDYKQQKIFFYCENLQTPLSFSEIRRITCQCAY